MADARASPMECLANGVTVITATQRLARELRRRFDQQQSAAGRRAWESADVLSWHAFLKRTWQRIGGGSGLLLNEWQLTAAWEAIIGDDIRAGERDVEPLWNTHASAKNAVDAWRLVNDWNIGIDQCAAAAAQSRHRDHQCWLRWARAFERRCAEHGWLDPHRLAGQLCDWLAGPRLDPPASVALPDQVRFSGFDDLTPQQQALVAALRGAGAEVEIDAPVAEAPARCESKIHRRAFYDQTAQWLSAAQWARERLRGNRHASIAIVAPHIAGAAPQIEYALRQILCPQRLMEPAADTGDAPYHISLGAPLDRHPVAKDALAALAAFGGRRLPAESVSRLILSPFIAGADSETAARCRLETACRRRLPYQIRFAQLVAELSGGRGRGGAPDSGDSGCPQLLAALRGALALLDHGARNRVMPASHWAHCFSDFLERLGWPGERGLSSGEYQAANALRRELQRLATLDLATAPLRAADALAWLRRRAAEQPFQVEARGAPVQVLGVFEAAGQHFDALWFGNLVETEWPPVQRPNPFIDLRLQRQAGVPAASTALNREHAQAIQRRLLASGDEVVLSRPVYGDEEVAVEPSPLFGGGQCDENAEPDTADAPRADTPARIVARGKPPLESFTDRRGPGLAAGGAAGGGVAVIENQAKCPFRAFALHRLGARDLEQNEQGLDAGERGSLIHRALQLVWEQLQSSVKLNALDERELQSLIADAAEQAARRYAVSSGCGERFHRVQVRWVIDTLREWLAVERQRGAFTVAACEKETTVTVNQLTLACKIDRIDRLQSGAAALIDYKTGAPDSLHHWSGPRPQSPQLPLYAIAQAEAVGVIAYGRVKKGRCAFSGIARSQDQEFAGQVGPVEKHRSLKADFDGWEALVRHWRRVLPQLAAEFTAGEARVDPFKAEVCSNCHLHTLCRIDAGAHGRS